MIALVTAGGAVFFFVVPFYCFDNTTKVTLAKYGIARSRPSVFCVLSNNNNKKN